MYSVRDDYLEVRLNQEVWDIFTLQAEIESMRRCGRDYATSMDQMRSELILEAAHQRVSARAKLDRLRCKPVDVTNLVKISKLCFVSRRLNLSADETKHLATNQSELIQQIHDCETQAEEILAEVISHWLVLRSSDWIKSSVLTDDLYSLVQQNILMNCGKEKDHPGVQAVCEAIIMLARDYKSEFEYLRAAAESEGWDIIYLDSPLQRPQLAISRLESDRASRPKSKELLAC